MLLTCVIVDDVGATEVSEAVDKVTGGVAVVDIAAILDVVDSLLEAEMVSEAPVVVTGSEGIAVPAPIAAVKADV